VLFIADCPVRQDSGAWNDIDVRSRLRRDVDFHSDVKNLDINVDKKTAMFQKLDSAA
jgi:hypothetical protein